MIFLESPWPILFIGIVAEAVLGIVLLRTGRGALLWAMIGVGVFTISGLIVERLVVTDRKAIQRTIDSAVDAILANDLDRLLDCVSPTAEQTRVEARLVFSRVEVTSVHLLNVEITIDYKSRPYTARVHFQAIGQARDRRGEIPYQGFNEKATVALRLEGKRWLVFTYDVDGLREFR